MLTESGPGESGIELLPGELAQIVESVFAAMLGLEAFPCAAPWVPDGIT